MHKHFAFVVVAGLVACGGSKNGDAELYAVGTYVGGGSYMTGPSGCTYEGDATVFADGKAKADEKGPRFLVKPGAFTATCGDSKTAAKAVEPTGAAIDGPDKVKRGTKSDSFHGHLVGDGKELRGEASVDWVLGPDCEGKAEFDAVMGSQDTGGKDRHRTLVTTGTGTCTVILALTTGSALYESFPEKSYRAEKKITIE